MDMYLKRHVNNDRPLLNLLAMCTQNIPKRHVIFRHVAMSPFGLRAGPQDREVNPLHGRPESIPLVLLLGQVGLIRVNPLGL